MIERNATNITSATNAMNAIRILSADMVQKANSGHPGFPLGAAPIAYEVWANQMRHNPKNPNWLNRDRFVLSAGHGSSMLYALLHLFGYGELQMEELKNFRQLDSLTPGHPEYKHTVGVEATTGPLGAGMGMAVGMAMAEAHLSAKFNREGFPIIDHYTYVLGGDGCMMEGITSEVMSLAGTLELHKLIVLYDSNHITIEGDTDIAFTEDVSKRFEAFGFQTLEVENGNDLSAIAKAIEMAKADTKRPSFIKITTTIGYGVPQKEGKSSAHGEPLGVENVEILRKNLNWSSEEAFHIPTEIYAHYEMLQAEGAKHEEKWNTLFAKYKETYPEMEELLEVYHQNTFSFSESEEEAYWKYENKADASRNISGRVLNEWKNLMPNLVGGSADLGPSNKSVMNGIEFFSKMNYEGRNIHFGVRELGMTAIANGMLLHGGTRAYVSTFFVFADYMKPMIRLSSLMGIPLTMIFTHDSIGVGEDGPTHEPVEQLTLLRSIPNIYVFRPADEMETRVAWLFAMQSKTVPTALVLTRQNLPILENTSQKATKGAYILEQESGEQPEVILIASGSEVALVVEAKKCLEKDGISVRVVSVPCLELFKQQTKEYQEEVLPNACRKRLVVEAGSRMSWGELIGLDGEYITMDNFGASAPANQLFEKYGFTVENVTNTAKKMAKIDKAYGCML